MRLNAFACLCLAMMFSSRLQAEPEPSGLMFPVEPRQMIVVITKDWQAVDGRLQRFEFNDAWQAVGQPIRVVVGRHGMGWGRGMHPMPQPGPQKKEGDGKSPAGVFVLRYAFGSAPAEKVPGIKMPYLHCTSSLECVDDPKSSHYNQILKPTAATPRDWHSSEKMLTSDGEYRLGLVIEHNTSPAEPGAGSCVFIHIWAGPGIGTVGCTAMRDGDIESLLGWIDVRANPVLAQLPEPEYHRLQKAWRLPEMPADAPAPSNVK